MVRNFRKPPKYKAISDMQQSLKQFPLYGTSQTYTHKEKGNFKTLMKISKAESGSAKQCLLFEAVLLLLFLTSL